jgi:hypothetical protein
MASRASNLDHPDWAPDEILILEETALNEGCLADIVELFPDRSHASIKTKMSKVRRELGIKGKRGAREEDQDTMNAKSVVATQKLLEATLSVGRWS